MAMSSDKTLWGFLFYVRHNPYNSVEAMTWDDLWELARQFAAVNVTAQTITPVTTQRPHDGSTDGFPIVDFSTDIDFPAYAAATRWAADGAGTAPTTTYAGNKLLCANAMYPEKSIA